MTQLAAAILKMRGAIDRLDKAAGRAATREKAREDGVRAQAAAIERLASENARLRSAREGERALRINALSEVDAAIAALELAVGESVADLIAQETEQPADPDADDPIDDDSRAPAGPEISELAGSAAQVAVEEVGHG